MRLKPISLYFIFVLLLSSNLQSQESKIPVAILTLEVTGIDSNAAITLSNRLRAELIKAGEFDVMERNRMEEILVEQGFQQTGACNTDECIVEAGRLLGVSRMIAGSVGKLGTLYSVTVRMIDVETGRILLTATEDSQGPIENVLTVSIKNAAKKLSALAATVGDRFIGFGSVKLSSKPKGARVFIDDRAIAGVTPLTVDSIKAGVHVVRIQKELLAGSKAVFIAPNEETSIALVLTLSKGALKIMTEPEDVEIFLDYKSMGFSPKKLAELAVGSYYLKLVKKGFVDYTQIVTIKEHETTIVTAKMIPMSFLSITTNPPDCQVTVDDSLIGKSPLTLYKIKPGFHKIKVGKKGFVSFEEIQSLPAGELASIDVLLEAVAAITVRSEPPEAELYIDGVFHGLTPLEVSNLKSGTINIKLQKELYENYRTQLVLDQGVTKNVTFTMIKNKGKLIIQSIPSKAIVEIDGIEKGDTPLEINDVEFGKHLLRVMKNGYKSYKETVEVKDHLPQVVKINFEIARGTLFLRPNPKDALVFLDGKRLNKIPAGGVELFPGEYHVSAIRPGYEKFTTTAIVKPQDGFSLDLKLNKKTKQKAVLRSLIFPGWGQKYAEKHTRKILFPLLEFSSLAAILITDIIYDNKISDYEDAKNKYLNAITDKDINRFRSEMDNAYNETKSVKNLQNTFIFAAVGVWALNILDSAIFEPLRPVIVPNEYGAKYSLKF